MEDFRHLADFVFLGNGLVTEMGAIGHGKNLFMNLHYKMEIPALPVQASGFDND
jgi:hypothetical protein